MHIINPTLEAEYNNRVLVPDHPAIFGRWQRDSATVRTSTRCTLDLAYGEHPRHKIDLFHANNPRGTVVFIHGGYWRTLDKSYFSFLAKSFVDAGLSVATINYRLCPTVRISDVAEDCRQALAWIITNGGALDLPVDRVALTGHSAGGHLVAMLYATDWAQRQCDVSGIIGGLALGGVYDLMPLLQCSMNADLKLNDQMARAISPIHLTPTLMVPLHLAVGADESHTFRTQSRLLAAAWPTICDTPEEVAGGNHFTAVDLFAQPAHSMFQRVVRLFVY